MPLWYFHHRAAYTYNTFHPFCLPYHENLTTKLHIPIALFISFTPSPWADDSFHGQDWYIPRAYCTFSGADWYIGSDWYTSMVYFVGNVDILYPVGQIDTLLWYISWTILIYFVSRWYISRIRSISIYFLQTIQLVYFDNTFHGQYWYTPCADDTFHGPDWYILRVYDTCNEPDWYIQMVHFVDDIDVPYSEGQIAILW